MTYMYFKTCSLVFMLVCSKAWSFAPPKARNARARSSLHYIDPDTATGYEDTPSVAATKLHRRRRPQKLPAPAPRTYKLNSKRVSELNESSSPDDVFTAIKRSQNTKDTQDIRVIGDFLFEGVGDSFGYGYKGTLLARLAVASLRLNEYSIAQNAIQMRKERFAESMAPFESAAIVRGLLRLHKVDEAFELLEDELSIEEGDKDRLRHRALSIASIASRHFFENEPTVALKACRMLAEMGPVVQKAGLQAEDLDMPWYRILAAADQCMATNRDKSYGSIVVDAIRAFPLDSNFEEVFDRLAE